MWGPVIGTLIFEILSLYIGPFSTYNSVILGFGVFICATLFPLGIIPVAREAMRGLFARVASGETEPGEPETGRVEEPIRTGPRG